MGIPALGRITELPLLRTVTLPGILGGPVHPEGCSWEHGGEAGLAVQTFKHGGNKVESQALLMRGGRGISRGVELVEMQFAQLEQVWTWSWCSAQLDQVWNTAGAGGSTAGAHSRPGETLCLETPKLSEILQCKERAWVKDKPRRNPANKAGRIWGGFWLHFLR